MNTVLALNRQGSQTEPLLTSRLKTLGIVAALTISLTNAHARPGETAPEIETRYGKPKLEKQSHGNISREYSYRGYRVSVLFQNGVCRTETYQKSPPTAFLDAEVSALLRANAGGGKWERVPIVTGPAAIWPSARTQWMPGVFYRGLDKRIAFHDTARHMLHISVEKDVFQKTIYR